MEFGVMEDVRQTLVAQTYIGNVHTNSALLAQAQALRESGRCLAVKIAPGDRTKGRILIKTALGQSIGIVKDRTRQVQEGDIFETAQGDWILVHLEAQPLMALRFSQPVESATALVQLGYALGNQHWPTTVKGDAIYVVQVASQAAMEKMVRDIAIALNLKGLHITFETHTADEVIFQTSHHTHVSHQH